MKKIPGSLVATTSMVLFVTIVLVQGASTRDDGLQRIASYKEWKRVTPAVFTQPILLDVSSSSFGG